MKEVAAAVRIIISEQQERGANRLLWRRDSSGSLIGDRLASHARKAV
jgi:hypothetical protein